MGDRLFTGEDFITGLSALCTSVRSTGLRTAQDPVRLIVTGGAVSVLYLHNRATTYDIDYTVQPLDFELVEVLSQLGWNIARQLHWPKSWFSGDVAGFLMDDEYSSVPAESVAQGVVLFEGDVLKVYAAKFEWSLTQKLIRVANEATRPRSEQSDWSDAIALVDVIEKRKGQSLTSEEILAWYPVNARDIPVQTVRELAVLYAERYLGRAIVL